MYRKQPAQRRAARKAAPPKVVYVAAPPAPAPRAPKQQKLESDIYADVSQAFHFVVQKPEFLFAIALALAIVISHAGDIDNGPLAPLFPKTSTNAFVIWVRANVKKFFGAITFAPALVDMPQKYKFYSFIAVPLWIFVTPGLDEIQYAIQAVIFFLFCHVKKANTRFALVAAAIGLYLLGLLANPFKDVQLAAKPGTTGTAGTAGAGSARSV